MIDLRNYVFVCLAVFAPFLLVQPYSPAPRHRQSLTPIFPALLFSHTILFMFLSFTSIVTFSTLKLREIDFALSFPFLPLLRLFSLFLSQIPMLSSSFLSLSHCLFIITLSSLSLRPLSFYLSLSRVKYLSWLLLPSHYPSAETFFV